MKVKDIISRVVLLYHDVNFVRITKYQYLQFLDDAILQTILQRPDAHEKRDTIKLVPGVRQKLPADGYTLLDVYANMRWEPSREIYLDGKPVYQVARKDLDYFRNWYATQQGNVVAEIDEFAFDIRTPKDFWVNPPVSVSRDVYVEIGYSYQHASLAEMIDSGTSYENVFDSYLDISDEFRNAIVAYMLYLCYSTDSSSELDRQVAASYYQMFNAALNAEYAISLVATSRIIEPTAAGLGVHTDQVPSAEQYKQ